jgi:hypothetical protein
MTRRRPVYSDRVRQFDCTIFAALTVGQRFRFSSEVDFPASGMKTGVCMKLSARRYKYEADGQENEVGSIKAVVLKVDDNGDLIHLGHHQ